jgi:hypothetical protein
VVGPVVSVAPPEDPPEDPLEDPPEDPLELSEPPPEPPDPEAPPEVVVLLARSVVTGELTTAVCADPAPDVEVW